MNVPACVNEERERGRKKEKQVRSQERCSRKKKINQLKQSEYTCHKMNKNIKAVTTRKLEKGSMQKGGKGKRNKKNKREREKKARRKITNQHEAKTQKVTTTTKP